MITAHLASGYCFAKLAGLRSATFSAAIVGAVFPDIDLLFFYFVDDRAIHHHRYWVHIPLFWLLVSALVLPVVWRTSFRPMALAFLGGISVHLLLDSVSGGIMWLAPWNDELLYLFGVPAAYSNWLWSFVFHWTFALELAIWALALFLFVKGRRTIIAHPSP